MPIEFAPDLIREAQSNILVKGISFGFPAITMIHRLYVFPSRAKQRRGKRLYSTVNSYGRIIITSPIGISSRRFSL